MMEHVWRTRDDRLLCRREPQRVPGSGGPIEQIDGFDLVDPLSGAILEKHRLQHTRFEQRDAWHVTGPVVEGDELIEILFRIKVPEHHGGQERTVLERTTLLAGLLPHRGRSWKTPTGHHLLEGAPQGTTYGHDPPCHLLEGLHDYTLVDPVAGAVLERFHRSDVIIGATDDEDLTRHRVEGDRLVEHVFYYHEDSCWGTSHLRGHRQNERIAGLVPLPGEP